MYKGSKNILRFNLDPVVTTTSSIFTIFFQTSPFILLSNFLFNENGFEVCTSQYSMRLGYFLNLIHTQITGANGHLGFRALVSALEAGYKVRAVVRRQAAADQIKAAKSVQPYLNQIEIVFIQDLLQDGAFDEAVVEMDYVLHIASPVSRPVSRMPRTYTSPLLISKSRVTTITRTSSSQQSKAPSVFSSQQSNPIP